jgi:hypothetical protein
MNNWVRGKAEDFIATTGSHTASRTVRCRKRNVVREER